MTAGSDLVGRRNVGKVKRTKYCEVYKAYFIRRAAAPNNPALFPKVAIKILT